MAVLDSIKKAFLGLAATAIPTIEHFHPVRAKLLAQKGKQRVDVRPDDPDLPAMSNIPLKVGVPGVEVTLPGGHTVLVQWEDGRPDRPIAHLWDPGSGGAVPLRVVWHALMIDLGGPCTPIQGVLNGEAVDPFTSLPHWMLGNASLVIRVKKTP